MVQTPGRPVPVAGGGAAPLCGRGVAAGLQGREEGEGGQAVIGGGGEGNIIIC